MRSRVASSSAGSHAAAPSHAQQLVAVACHMSCCRVQVSASSTPNLSFREETLGCDKTYGAFF
eukprot:6472410-Amphidinium_carterae.1